MKNSGLIAAFALEAVLAAGMGYVIGRTADHSASGNAAPAATVKLMPDGTVRAGLSPSTGAPLFTTLADAPGSPSYNFDEAEAYCAASQEHGHNDWRVPAKGELMVLWENRNKGKLQGTFNETADPASWYWSSSPAAWGFDWAQHFSDGDQDYNLPLFGSSLRCVR